MGDAGRLRVRQTTTADRQAVRAVVLAAFAEEPVVGDIVDDLHRAGRAVVELVAVRERPGGEEVVGHVLLSRCWVDDPERLVPALVLSPLGVRPEDQGRGTGTALLRHALDAARRRGESHVFLEGGPGYYGPRGFTRADRLGFARPTDRIPAPAFQVAVLRELSMSGRVVYPDAFWAHDAAGLRGAVLARVRAALGE